MTSVMHGSARRQMERMNGGPMSSLAATRLLLIHSLMSASCR
jgi:hypothetical protein